MNFEDVKVIFIDIDGTLVTDENQVPSINKEQIKKMVSSGKYVVLCSGRNSMYIKKFVKEAGTSNYSISSNGSLVYDYKNDEIIYESKIDFNVVKEIWTYAYENKISISLNACNKRYASKYVTKNVNTSEVIILENKEDIDNIKDVGIHQISVNGTDYDKINNIINFATNKQNLDVTNCALGLIKKDKNANKYYADLNNKNSNKGNGIAYFLKYMKISNDNTMCFGDHINDISMFKNCKYTVAMKNAMVELKEKAKYITLSNNNGGVGEFLKRM